MLKYLVIKYGVLSLANGVRHDSLHLENISSLSVHSTGVVRPLGPFDRRGDPEYPEEFLPLPQPHVSLEEARETANRNSVSIEAGTALYRGQKGKKQKRENVGEGAQFIWFANSRDDALKYLTGGPGKLLKYTVVAEEGLNFLHIGLHSVDVWRQILCRPELFEPVENTAYKWQSNLNRPPFSCTAHETIVTRDSHTFTDVHWIEKICPLLRSWGLDGYAADPLPKSSMPRVGPDQYFHAEIAVCSPLGRVEHVGIEDVMYDSSDSESD